MDYNKQYFWKSENRFLDNKKLLAEVWCLKPSLKTAAVQVCTFNGIKTISDFKKISTEALVIGTELQKYNLFCEISIGFPANCKLLIDGNIFLVYT